MNKALFLVLITTILYGCARISTNVDQASTVGKEGTGQQQTGLQGNWKTTCNSGVNRHAAFSGANLVFNVNNYRSSDCTGVLGSILEANFTYQASLKVSSDPSLYNLEYVLQNMTILVLDPQTATAFNLVSHCGFTDWGVGVKKDITGLACVASGPKANVVTYSILKYQDTQIQIGQTEGANDGTSEALRHSAYDPNTYTRAN
jgi:hypothetical protein